jgi:hypothetical protein
VVALEKAQKEVDEQLTYLSQQQSHLESNLTALSQHLSISAPDTNAPTTSASSNPRQEMYALLAKLSDDLTNLQSDLIQLSHCAIAQTEPAMATTASGNDLSILDTLRVHREAILWIEESTKKLAEHLIK